jgi:hypothetical protein
MIKGATPLLSAPATRFLHIDFLKGGNWWPNVKVRTNVATAWYLEGDKRCSRCETIIALWRSS